MRLLITLTIAGALALAGCGDDDDDAVAPTTTTAPSTTTIAPDATPASAAAAAGSYVPGADPEADAVAEAWTAAFDSTTGFDDKAPFIADADALRTTIEAYTPAGDAVGGIALVPTAIVITGDTAAVTYDVTFAGQPAYQDQDGVVDRVDGAWVVSRDEFCGFMAAARNPCA
jgi:iron complex transport system substrate-binding protein